jgi:hypothetical protein
MGEDRLVAHVQNGVQASVTIAFAVRPTRFPGQQIIPTLLKPGTLLSLFALPSFRNLLFDVGARNAKLFGAGHSGSPFFSHARIPARRDSLSDGPGGIKSGTGATGSGGHFSSALNSRVGFSHFVPARGT